MSEPKSAAAPASGITDDPEVLALLDFEPVPRARVVEGAWTPELQREFIVRLAVTGSIGRAAEEMGKNETGVRKLYRNPEGESFRAAWDAAIELAKSRRSEHSAFVEPGTKPPSLDNRRKTPAGQVDANGKQPLPGQVLNEHGEWEDEASYVRRGEEAKDSIANKLRRSRRLFLHDISGSPVMRAAFEILTELPVDWEKAAKCQPQDDEPWRRPNMHQRDMLLTAENGWLGSEFAHGPDRKAELLAEINEWREGEGLPLVAWDE